MFSGIQRKRSFTGITLLVWLFLTIFFAGDCLSANILFSTDASVDFAAPEGGKTNTGFLVKLNKQVLHAMKPGMEFTVILANNQELTVKIDEIENRPNGKVWKCSVPQVYGTGTALFFIKNSVIAGRVFLNGIQYTITAKGIDDLYQIDNSKDMKEPVEPNDFIIPPVAPVSESSPGAPMDYAAPSGDGSTTIDLLILYTHGMALKYKGEALDTYLNMLVELANDAYKKSKINLKLNLVGKHEVNYPDDTRLDTALTALRLHQGVFSNVPALRNQVGADLVALVRVFHHHNDKACGLAYLLQHKNSSSQSLAFSVVQTGHASDNYYCNDYTLAHELGHNMGCAHDKGNAGSHGIYSYSYGYGISGSFGTIMSYLRPRIGYFSNPDITYKGHPIGIPNQADNARTINNTKAFIAGYRKHVAGGSGGGGGGTTTVKYCSAQAGSQKYEWIKTVALGGLTNSSGPSHYSNFTSKTATLKKGAKNYVSLTPGFSGKAYNEYWRIWIDYNKDGDFNDPGELVFSGHSTAKTAGYINVPASASGTTRMRIIMQYKSYPAAPCGNVKFGEVEDYTVKFGTSSGGSGGGGGNNGGGSGGGGGGTTTVKYCSAQAGSQKYEWIKTVALGGLTNSSGPSHYSNFTSKTATLKKGAKNYVSLTPGFSGKAYNEYWRIWIDYNKDGDFNDPGELVFSGHSTAKTAGYINVPASASGTTRMRIIMQYKSYPAAPCGNIKFGEVEDYTVKFGSAL